MLNATNHFNRVLVIAFLLVLAAGSLSLGAAVAADLIHGSGFTSGSAAGVVAHAIDSLAAGAHAWLATHALAALGLGATVALLSLFLLWIELRHVLAQPQLVLSRGHLGQVAISLDQIGILAQHEAESVEGVREVRTVAQAHKAGINVQQTVAVEPEQPLPALAEQIQQRVKQSLEYHLGFPVAAVRVQLQQASLSKALL
jgi:uncharacterized alkaline shock family protein YloU